MGDNRTDPPRWGLWLVGARGSVATTMTTGWAAMVGGLAGHDGMVTALSAFDGAPLPALADLVIGGCDIADVTLRKRAEYLEHGGVIPHRLSRRVGDELDMVDERIVTGVTLEEARHRPTASLEAITGQLQAFRRVNDLDQVVVINVASTEPPLAPDPCHDDADALLAEVVEKDRPVLSATGLYAMAALTMGMPFVDFTPSAATTLPAMHELARRHGVPLAGRDGKTGETLLKTALAPMFADRALRVRSWSGMNLLGGGDGQTLADPVAARSKLDSKTEPLEAILGYQPEGPVRIDHVPDLGDWKTAWDLITFEGFLGTRMQLQFTWQGCDSALAAPLVLDLARLVTAAARAGRAGPLDTLGYFFKAPIGGDEHRLAQQFEQLVVWAHGLSVEAA